MQYYKNCLVCGDYSDYGKELCYNCWEYKEQIKDEYLSKNISKSKANKILEKAIDDLKNPKTIHKDEVNIELTFIAVYEILEENFKTEFIKDKFEMLKDFKKIRYKKNNNSERNYQLEDPEEDYRKTHETKYRCRDGHYVRSKIEREIDNFLFENRIWHEYEKEEINLENNETFYVDFYLIDYQIYIEHFGLTGNKAYDDKSERKNKYFIENKKRFIYTQSSDESNIEERLIRKIRELEYREKIKILK